MKPNILYAFDKVHKAILTSTTYNQLCTANRMRIAFDDMFIYGRLVKNNDSYQVYSDKLMREFLSKTHDLCE